MNPKFNISELKQFTSPRKLIAFLNRRGYDTRDLIAASMRYKKTRKPDKTNNRISVEWIIEYLQGNYVEIVENPVIVEPKPKEIRVPLRHGMDWYLIKTKYKDKFEVSTYKEIYGSIDDFAKFATQKEIDSL